MNPILKAENFLLGVEGVVHGFGTKAISSTDDLAKHLEVKPEQILTLNQIHSNAVIRVSNTNGEDDGSQGDALVTDVPGQVLAIRTADCLPVLLCDPQHRVVAAVHAGWRGLAKQILVETIEIMNHHWGCDVQNLRVAFGPAIGPEHYEVGKEVIDEMRESMGLNFTFARFGDQQFALDLTQSAAQSLEQLGLHPRNFHFLKNETFGEADLWHSFRRDGESAGRQYSFIGILD